MANEPPPSAALSAVVSATSSAQQKARPRLWRVEAPSKVCMVTDRYMGKLQIPIEVKGHTYYGCCPMCEGKLRDEPGYRRATDPETGNAVDKASAFLARTRTNKIYYFENEDTYRQYASGP